MSRLDIRRSKVETVVSGMLRISWGSGPTTPGQWDGAGRWMWSWVGAGGAPRGPYFSLQNVSLPRTGGIVSKSCGGGGDEVRHSSVRPSHGSAGAGAPARRLHHALTMKRRTPAAIPKAPTVETAFQRVQPVAPAYV